MFNWLFGTDVKVDNVVTEGNNHSFDINIKDHNLIIVILLTLITLIKIIELYMFYKKALKNKINKRELMREKILSINNSAV